MYPHLPDEGLQKRYAFDINSVPKEVDFFTTGMNKIIKCYDLKKVNNLEIPTDFRPIDLLRLIEYEIPGNVSTHNGAYCYMNFLDIRETYQYIIEEVPDYNRTSFQNAFLQWIKTTEYGKNTRFTGYSNQRVRDFMRNETSRNYEIINPTPEEKSKLEFFENAVEQILDKIVENLGVNITQTFAYTKSDNPVTANWIIDEIDNQIKINWLWDKDGVLDFLNNPKEMMDAYIHELTHVFEGLSRKNYTGSESNSNRETHDNRFLASLRLLAINCT